MLVVADTSALVALASCDGLGLLDALFGDIRVPRAVWDECAVGGKRLHADRLLVDDARARKVARLNAIAVVGSLGVLLLAKDRELITAAAPRLAAIEAAGIYIAADLVGEALRLAGE